MTKENKIKRFESLMNQAFRLVEQADDVIEGSEPVREVMENIDSTTEQVVRAIKESK